MAEACACRAAARTDFARRVLALHREGLASAIILARLGGSAQGIRDVLRSAGLSRNPGDGWCMKRRRRRNTPHVHRPTQRG
jgi:hypothetical protein